MKTHPGRLHHNTPSWVPDGVLFHIRVRADRGQKIALTDSRLGTDLTIAVQRYHHLQHWWCELFLLMPDHLHAILGFPAEPGMIRTMRSWKRGTARFQGVLWQDGFFDHRLRNYHEVQLKWDYIRENPIVKELCADVAGWPWWWSAVADNPRLPASLRGGAR